MILRWFLFLGLIVHKLVWEVLRRRGRGDTTIKPMKSDPLKRIIKSAKIGLLLFIVIQTLFLDVLSITSNPIYLQIVGGGLYVVGLSIAIAGRLHLGGNWANLEDYQVVADQTIVTRGVYAFVRHPIYLGDLILLTGLELALNSWLVLIVPFLAVVVVRQARREEELMLNALPDYRAYQQRTSMFIPYIL